MCRDPPKIYEILRRTVTHYFPFFILYQAEDLTEQQIAGKNMLKLSYLINVIGTTLHFISH